MRLSLLCLISIGLLGLGCSKKEEASNEAVIEQPAANKPTATETSAPSAPPASTASEAGKTADTSSGPKLLIPAQQNLDEETKEDLADTVLGTLVRPVYPQSLRDKSIEGEAVVEYSISSQGTVASATVLSATHPLFAEAALSAVKQWTFNSASGKDKITPRKLRQAFPFIIKRPDPDEIHGETKDYPVLGGLLRPPHTGEPGRALIELHLDRTAVVEEVRILEATGGVNEEIVKLALREWLFLPYFKDGSYTPTKVLTEIVFTEGGNVLVQYPYNGAHSSAASK